MGYYARVLGGVALGFGYCAYLLLGSGYYYWMGLASALLVILFEIFHDMGPRWGLMSKGGK